MTDTLLNLNTLPGWNVTDGGNTPLPEVEGCVFPGLPMWAALGPTKAFRQLYAYRASGSQAWDTVRGIAFGATLRFPTLIDLALSQQVELDLDLVSSSKLHSNGGIAARFVGPDAWTWHTFDMAGQKWITTEIQLPPATRWLTGVQVVVDYVINADYSINFTGMAVNGKWHDIGRIAKPVQTTWAPHINVGLQLDANANGDFYHLAMSDMSLEVRS